MKATSSFVIALATLGLGLSVSGAAQAAAPVIYFAQVWAGGQINISGNNFGTTAGSVTVKGSRATVTSWSDTQIFVSNPLPWPLTAEVVVNTTSKTRATGYLFNQVSVLPSVAHTRDSYGAVTVVSLNGGGNQIHVSPGATVTLDLDFSALNNGTDIGFQFGFNTGAPQTCFIGNGTGHITQTLTAPTTPGIYYVLFDSNLNYCNPSWDAGTPPQAQAIGAISVY
jgi:hypothetical protein